MEIETDNENKDPRILVNNENNIGFGSLAIALLFICFWGSPDLIDAIIYWLSSGNLNSVVP